MQHLFLERILKFATGTTLGPKQCLDVNVEAMPAVSLLTNFVKDGVTIPVSEDTITPANNAPLPVKLTSATGPINITAGDLNVQISHAGVNYDSTRIGDGTYLLGITSSNEAKTYNADLHGCITANKVQVDVATLPAITFRQLISTGATYDSVRIGDGTTLAGVTVSNELKVSDATLAAKDFATQTTLAALNTKVTAVDTGSVTVASSALPTGAATESTLSTLNGKVTACNTGSVTISSSALPTGAATDGKLDTLIAKDFATQTTLAALNTKVTACNTGAVTVSSSALPTGAATDAKLDTLIAKDFATQTTLAAILAKLASGTVIGDVNVNRLDIKNTAYVDFSSTSLPGNATNPVQLVASLSAAIKQIQVFDTGGNFMEVMTGAAASEVRKFVVGPGSNETIDCAIAAGTRVSVRRIDSASAATVGAIACNFLG